MAIMVNLGSVPDIDVTMQQISINTSEIIVYDKTHVHTQSTPAAEWTIRHNLGKYPCVSVVDSSGSEVVGAVDYPNENT